MTLISMYSQNMLAYVAFALPVWIVVRIAYLKLRRSRATLGRELVLGLVALYAVGLVSQTVLPPGDYGFEDGAFYAQPIIRPEAQYNLVPARSIFDYAFGTNDQVSDWDQVSKLNLLGNVGLFVPFGFLLPLVRRKRTGLWQVMAIGVATSLTIETVQFFWGRSADIDDVLLNSVGVLLGYLALLLCRRVWRRASAEISPSSSW